MTHTIIHPQSNESVYICPMHPDVIRHHRGLCPQCGMILVKQETSTHQANPRSIALSATLHCLAGCAIGEMIGVTIGTAIGLPIHQTILLAALLSFLSGYSFSTWPLLKAKTPFLQALRLVVTADTLSILAMTITDNIIILLIPGAMDKNLSHPIYWLSRIISLSAAFMVGYPVNSYLLRKGRGHALYHGSHEEPDTSGHSR